MFILSHVCKGEGGIGRKILEDMKGPLDLFDRLRTRLLLKRDNLLYLQECLWVIKRIDLVKKAVEFARDAGNTLHLNPASDQPG